MNIVQIGPYPISSDCIHGGVEASVYGLAQELAKNHTVDVFDIPRIGEKDWVERYENLTIHRYANPGTHNKDSVLRLKEMVRDIVALGPKVCHVHGTGAFSKEIYFALQSQELRTMSHWWGGNYTKMYVKYPVLSQLALCLMHPIYKLYKFVK